MVVDHEDGAGVAGERAQAPRQRQELAPREQLLAELEDLGAAAEGGRSNGGQAVGVVIRGDDVEVGGEQAVEEGVARGLVNLPRRPD